MVSEYDQEITQSQTQRFKECFKILVDIKNLHKDEDFLLIAITMLCV